MDRVLRRTSATIQARISIDGLVSDPSPDAATVTITRADGTAIVTNGAAADLGVGVFGYTLSSTDTAQLDRLTADWTVGVGGQPQVITTLVEVVGGFLFTIAEARALKPLDSTTTYTTAQIIDMRTTVEQALEEECGVAFVPRYTLETVNGSGTTSLLLRWPKVTAIRSATVGTSVLGVSDLAALTYGAGGVVDGYWWTAGIGNLTVGYEHGYSTPPAEVRRAALLLAKIWLTSQARPIDDRAITFNAGADGGTYSLAVPGRNGSAFGHPDVDVAVQRYGMRVGVA